MTTDAGQPAEGSNRTPALWPFYVGGFLGPFGGAMVNAILPEVAQGLGTDEAGASAGITTVVFTPSKRPAKATACAWLPEE